MDKRVLVMSPHCDDGELGCGGSIAKFSEMGYEIYYVSFSDSKTTLSDEFEPDTLRKETNIATKILGIKEENVMIYDFTTRHYSSKRQEILDEIIELRHKIDPGIILTPSTKDVHQDHQTVTNEVLRAFKKGEFTILGYEEPWNCFTFDSIAFICLEKSHVDKKVNAVMSYESQCDRNYRHRDFIEGLAITRGTQIGHTYAEAFEVLRYVIK
jgi:LmbE family N-acetylglucosaminyl deacetylase